ncbi:glycosyltransferase [Halalkaliarchaeum sp. AArc-GB]|uniref:glycosyltransferase n=1 Tax=unclassified Halalkaliarchaeum TaxID=2678344 RepID=UPI00217D6B2E|nr:MULTISPECIES: glycosyltransferase [unclassified Halalkaliarchaeum]MDR5673724.1 glycosyltransferase [Halalkaliarchaeum sp. AArc-GB]
MARVAVVHNTLDFRGGADVVALSVCDALDAGHRGSHDVDLFTIAETDPDELAPRFGLDVDVPVCEPPMADRIARTLGTLTPQIGPQMAARSALVSRFFRRHADGYDLAVSTTNELSLPLPSVQYVHFPQFSLGRLPDRFDADPGRFDWLWARLSAPTPGELPDDATFVANSEWTADAVEAIYGRSAAVVYPPVRPIPGPRPWEERELGAVVVGRIAPDRRTFEAIDVVDRVRDRGHDLHLHVVGTAPRAYRPYVDRVRRAARGRPYVHLETDVPRDRLEALLRSHRYGLNVRPDESFGIGVAEFRAAGMIAFAPDAGGQREVLDGRSDRLFESLEEAVDLLSASIESGDRPGMPTDRFGPDRFRSEIRTLVADALAEL